jgi:hypothetical protein
MTAEEIRNLKIVGADMEHRDWRTHWIKEIAYQLAVMNEHRRFDEREKDFDPRFAGR